MGFAKEFKEFAMKGNVMDMAVGVIIGGAFGKIVSSLVEDIIMPPIAALMGNVDFSSLSVKLKEVPAVLDEAGNVVTEATTIAWKYGAFIQNVIDFLIVALCIFFMIKAMNKLSKKKAEEPAPDPEPSAEEKLLGEIRDLLKANK
ncbi:MAG: large-conductance mechanosensitive channel protein MscL [Muribaculaceae bacterium]|nr:large-conductance mechanosensitive channel protein MscL [Muribaculaceae bacterium]